MLDDILKRGDVSRLIKEIATNNRYNKKEKSNSINYLKFVDFEQPLFIVVDALFKYKVIIDDIYLLDDFVDQLDLLFRKLDNFYDINIGINKLILKFVIKKLGYKDKVSLKRKEILTYIYDKYILNGYIFHSISDVYKESIEYNGFIPQNYNNLYEEFKEVKSIVGDDILENDFNNNDVAFTDSFLMAYYYAINSPIYFYKIMCGNHLIQKEEDKEAYFKNDYVHCFKNLNKLIYKLDLNEEKGKKVRYICNKEWNLINRSSYCPTVMVIKRSLVLNDKLEDYYDIINDTTSDLADLVGKIIDSKFNSISVSEKISADDLEFIKLPSYQDIISDDTLTVVEKNIISSDKINDNHGKVSFLVILGILLITLGVVFSFIMMG